MIVRQFTTGIMVICVCAALTGCSRSPRVSFYTLGNASVNTTVNPSNGAPSLSVANITLPDLVDRPQLVEYVTGNRVEILDTHRWAEPLKNGISRLLVESLASQLETDKVAAYPNTINDPTYRIFVDIQRFESMGDTVSVEAIWTIRRTPVVAPGPDKQDKCVNEAVSCQNSSEYNFLHTKTGRSQFHESKGGEGYDSLVAAYNRAILSVSKDIAQAIRSELTVAR